MCVWSFADVCGADYKMPLCEYFEDPEDEDDRKSS
jgi:hypothetical protein